MPDVRSLCHLTDCRGMGILTFIDAAYPMSAYPVADGFAFYIGGDTPHVWSSAEVAVLKQHYRYLLPIYVRSNPPGPGAVADVAAAVAKLASLGAPQGCLVAWDYEVAVDVAYTATVYGLLALAGYTLIDYGSRSYVTGNQNPDGYYWGADWTSVPHLHAGDQITQYVNFSAYDESLASSALPFWDTRGLPYPVLRQGASGAAVVTLQNRLNVWGARLTADGSFGALTEAVVLAFQVQAFGAGPG